VLCQAALNYLRAGHGSGAWAKMRVELSQELVIGGYTSGPHGFDSVLIGFYRGDVLYFSASVSADFGPLATAVCGPKSHLLRLRRVP
jgi:hypothetical protein